MMMQKLSNPHMVTQTTTNERTLHHCRRRQRQKEGIWGLMSSLPQPYGIHAPSYYRDLHVWASDGLPHPGSAPVVEWQQVPASCEPCAFLGSHANRRIKQSKSVKSVLAHLGLQQQQGQPEQALLPQQQAHVPTMEEDSAADLADKAQLDKRGMHKRWQVESFVLVLRRLLSSAPDRAWHIVDFGCGTGGLLLPLACLFPSCTFTGVEMNPAALAILRQRATVAGLTNVHTFVGMIENFEQPFDVALALHACGNATDMAMLRAEQHRAAYIVSPCCVGKLKFSLQGGSSFSNTTAKWRWNPRMKGSTAEEIHEAGESLLAAAMGPGAAARQLQQEAGQARRQSTQVAELPTVGRLNGMEQSLQGSGVTSEAAEQLPCSASAAEAGGQQAATGSAAAAAPAFNMQALRHPRSDVFMSLLPDPQANYKLMAQVADTVYVPDRVQQQQLLEDWQNGKLPALSHEQALTASLAKLATASTDVQHARAAERSDHERAASSVQQGRDAGVENHNATTVTSSSVLPSHGALHGPGETSDPVAIGTAGDDVSHAAEEQGPEDVSARQVHAAVAIQDADSGVGDAPADSAARKAAHCALAKLHVELDRNEAARESGYAVGIFRMLNAGYMAKGDLLVGLPAEQQDWKDLLHLLQLPDAQPGAM